MKKVGLICLILCLLLSAQSWSVPVQATGGVLNGSVVNGCHSLDAGIPLLGKDPLIPNAKSVFLFEANSETLMYAYNADEQAYPASLVKIMTALVVAEQGSMTDAVTVSANVLATVPTNAVSADLQADEVLTVQDLLYCMMVDSANDAAAVLADHISGSQGAFVAEMNRYAQSLGCTGTNFTNVHGLHDERQYTTARDTARILAAAMKNELFRTVFGTVNYTVPATNKSEARNLSTGNFLMNDDGPEIYYDGRVTGGRTGVTEDGYRCIATAAEAGGLELLCVVLGAESKYEEDGYTEKTIGGFLETTELLNKGFEGFSATQILFAGQALKQCSVVNGDADVVVGPLESVSTVLPQGVSQADLTYRYTDVNGGFQAPIEKGKQLSTLEVWYGNICVAQVDLYAMNAVPVQQIQSNEDPGKDTDPWPVILIVVGTIVAVVLVLFAGVRVVRRVRMAAARNRSRRHRRNRRRSR